MWPNAAAMQTTAHSIKPSGENRGKPPKPGVSTFWVNRPQEKKNKLIYCPNFKTGTKISPFGDRKNGGIGILMTFDFHSSIT